MIICSIDVAKSKAEQSAVIISRWKDGKMEVVYTDQCEARNKQAHEDMIKRVNDKYPHIDKTVKS